MFSPAGTRQWDRSVRRATALAGAAVLALSFAPARADTVATFTWVENSGSGSHAESGTLQLTLPGTDTSPFSVPFSQGSTSSAPDLSSLSYTYSNGTTVSSPNLTSFVFTDSSGNPSANASWATTSSGHGGFGVGTTDLITGFVFSDAAGQKISESLSLASNEGLASNQMNGVNDSGYWKLTSLAPVPLPSGLLLLLSGLGFTGIARRYGSKRSDR